MPDSLRALTLFVAGAFVLAGGGGLLLPGRPLMLAVLVPLWMGVVSWDRWRRVSKQLEQRQATGQCLHCGYDLTGNASGVCPECGEAT